MQLLRQNMNAHAWAAQTVMSPFVFEKTRTNPKVVLLGSNGSGLCVADVLRLRIINECVLRTFLQLSDAPPSNAILVEISAIPCVFFDAVRDAHRPAAAGGAAQHFFCWPVATLCRRSSSGPLRWPTWQATAPTKTSSSKATPSTTTTTSSRRRRAPWPISPATTSATRHCSTKAASKS